ncbi:MAG: hypothetical protein DWQ47_15765 [Acidobacteria bacterium]|nr:MAG: hypothetical protein DWQ32_03165 [Acidobacteriota bacterium]REK02485.1 MAG: hypothetical protein DWQ38_08970 [Acidobacteriota bacterium]REK13713.1 MAG: hypothetical protein DWQ43_08855 [Acidobacteriota bacterium]REK41707.1 MAG: hypothetical protein DWQ47_15765 [Acidobacteriota bacterium]
MKRQILSVFLTSLLIAACNGPARVCVEFIGAGRTAIITDANGRQTVVTADQNGNVTIDCNSTVETV